MLTANQFQSIYKEFIESGLTIRDFCANHYIRSLNSIIGTIS